MGRIRNFFANVARMTEPPPSLPAPGAGSLNGMKRSAAAGYPYDAGATGRRAFAWQATQIGQNTLLWGNLDNVRARSRDAVRNNAWAASALDRFESNCIGTGIQPHFQHPDEAVRDQLSAAWNRWIPEADFGGQLDFYGLQALLTREIFEAGESFIRYRLRPSSDRAFVPLQLQLLEGEQLPIWRQVPNLSNGGAIRSGIEFDAQQRRVAYHFYKEHPGESMYYPDAYAFARIPANEIQHVYRLTRAGQLRGEPRMTSVLALLYELEQYTDAALVKKKIAAMFAGFIKKDAPEIDLLPPDPGATNPPQSAPGLGPDYYPDPGTSTAKIETGSLQELNPGEDITFPSIPTENDFQSFMRVQLHKFCAGIGLTFEQVTGDLENVNYSSIRAGTLEFRRSCEQFQYLILVQQACMPILRRWMDEAVMAGRLQLPGYFQDPYPYQQVEWNTPGWEWVDPLKEAQAAQLDVRNGFTTRTQVIRARGYDPNMVDIQTAQERKRSEDMGLVYDSNPNQTLLRGTHPEMPAEEPEEEQPPPPARSTGQARRDRTPVQ